MDGSGESRERQDPRARWGSEAVVEPGSCFIRRVLLSPPFFASSSSLGPGHSLPEPGALGHPCSAPLDVFPGAEVLLLRQGIKQAVAAWTLMLPDSLPSIQHP